MSSINPFSGYVAQGAVVERTASAEKTRQGRESAEVSKKLAARDDEMEHQVESSDEVAAIHEENGSGQQQQQPRDKGHKPEKDEPTHLDVKA
jgi:hypothetical protein